MGKVANAAFPPILFLPEQHAPQFPGIVITQQTPLRINTTETTMKLPITLLASVGLLAALAATAHAGRSFNPSGGTIKTGPIVSPCAKNPKSCGEGYNPLKKPHVPTTPKSPA